ncbi:MAG: hypothetical protein AAF926_00305 [Pseudomonadota bacterium]
MRKEVEYVMTDDMVAAGVYELRQFPMGGDMSEIVKDIYIAMRVELGAIETARADMAKDSKN